ncbi:MAG: CRTAC1 family protein, partial [Planctomycetes bacterium]|nr:CRTAC1 family protein [Planctomycetota bacterium]
MTGLYTVRLWALDKVVQEAELLLDVRVDGVAPAMPVFDALPTITNQRTLDISGGAEAVSRVDLRINDGLARAVFADAAAHFVFTAAALPSEGLNYLQATATDAAGNVSGTGNAVIERDTLAPAINISGVIHGHNYRGAVTPQVQVSDKNLLGGATQVTLNGMPFSSGTRIDADGDYLLSVAAADAAGNSAAAQVAFVIDASPPAAPVLAQALSPTNHTAIALQATYDAADTQRLELFHGGISLGISPADGSGASTWTNVALAEGDNLFEIEAWDEIGNVSRSAPMHVDGDRTAPAWVGAVGVQFVSPGNGAAWIYWNDALERNGPVRWNIYYGTSLPLDFSTAVKLADVQPESGGTFTWAYRVDGLQNNTTYYFAVRAEDRVTDPNEDANTITEWVTPHPGASFRHHAWGSAANGLSVTDLDGDGAKEVLLATDEGLRIRARDAQGEWVDVTSAWGAFPAERCLALLAADFDNDGDEDVVLAGQTLRLYRNDGVGHLVEATVGSGFANPDGALSVSVNGVSVGGDGFLDLMVGFELTGSLDGGAGAQGTGLSVPGTSNPPDSPFVEGGANGISGQDSLPANGEGRFFTGYRNLGDMDGDLLGNGEGRFFAVYRNLGDMDGDGRGELAFVDETEQTGLSRASAIRSVVAGDLDGDGAADLLLAGGNENTLFFNDGTGHYVDMTSANMPAISSDIRGTLRADLDGDGDLDLFLANRGEHSYLFLNDGTGRFLDASSGMRGLVGTETITSAAEGDFDNDGDRDLFLSLGSLNLLLENRGDGTFVEISGAAGVRAGGGGETAVSADLDGDGDLDVVTSGGDLYENLQNDAGWLQVRLVGTLTNADAVGSRVMIYSAGHLGDPLALEGFAEVASGMGYRSQSPRELHFGLDPAAIYDVRAVFGSGIAVETRGVSTGRLIVLIEDNTPPVAEDDDDVDGMWRREDALIRLSATDVSSGVGQTLFRLDGQESVYAGPIAIGDEGAHLLEYWSVDLAKNVETLHAVEVLIDKTAPVTGHDCLQDDIWVNTSITVNLLPTDARPSVQTSGVAHTYALVNGAPQAADVLALPFTADGIYAVQFWSIDAAGNEETPKALTVKIDTAPPATVIAVGEPKHQG